MDLNIEKTANLARLSLSDDEKQKFGNDLSAILEYVKKLERLDTTSVEPTSHVLDLQNVFREDKVQKSMAAERALKHAPESDGLFFKVPKIVQRD